MLELNSVSKRFAVRSGLLSRDELTAVDSVSFTIREGETLGLVGESGCGKSTIGRSILNLVQIDEGVIRFLGKTISNLSEKAFRAFRNDIQMVFQNPVSSFNPLFSIRKSLLDPLALRPSLSPRERNARVIDLLDSVKLPADFADKKPHQLSGGQLQRAALARALAPRPRLIFLDEPTSALDMSIRGQIVNLLLDIQAEMNISYIFVSHDLRVIKFVADRVLVMYLGQVVEEGSSEDILGNPMHPYTQGLLAATFIGGQRRKEVSQLGSLSGEVLRQKQEKKGCKLYGRCRFALDQCTEPQELAEIRPTHWVRCWRANELN